MDTENTLGRSRSRSIIKVDIVKYSLLENAEKMVAVTQTLFSLLHSAIPQSGDSEESFIWCPAGDGGAIIFDDLWAALDTALALDKLLKAHNSESNHLKFELRIGIHNGETWVAHDFDGDFNVWGDGINIASRLADCAKPGQILASYDYCRELGLIDPKKNTRREDLQFLGQWWIKHQLLIEVCNINIEGTGVRVSPADRWYLPFRLPLKKAIEIYEIMLIDHWPGRMEIHTFRAMLLCKQLLNLDEDNYLARDFLKTIAVAQASNHPFYHSIFSQFDSKELEDFFKYSYVVELEPEDVLFADEPVCKENLIIVIYGSLKMLTANGSESFFEYLPEGHIFVDLDRIPEARPKFQATGNTGVWVFDVGLFGEKRPEINSQSQKSTLISKIWPVYQTYHLDRILANNEVFQYLLYPERSALLKQAETRLVDLRYVKNALDSGNFQDYWILVLEGQVTFHISLPLQNQFPVKYNNGDVVGTFLQFADDLSVIKRITVSDNALVVLMPRNEIDKIISSNRQFRQKCETYFTEIENRRWDYIW